MSGATRCPANSDSSCAPAAAPSRLRLGHPGDAREHEADRVAAAVMRPQATGQAPTIGRATVSVQRQGGVRGGEVAAPAIVGQAIAGAGRPLDTASRAWFEPRFGRALDRVRVHTGALAERSAAAIGARAYTVGSDIVFGAGQHVPGSATGRRLLAHELTHVLQQGSSDHLVQRELVYGSGYPNPFAGKPADETAAAQKSPTEWFPSSVDFARTAELSGGGTGVSTLTGLLTEIGSKGVGAINDLGLIGHANANQFAFGGAITRTTVSGTAAGMLDDSVLAARQADINKVRNRFAAGAHMTLYGCNSGSSGALLQAFSTAFKVCARGFKDPISWCLGWQTNPLVIHSRGRTLINPADGIGCDQYNASVRSLVPDTEDCLGTKPKPPDVTLPKRTPVVSQVPE